MPFGIAALLGGGLSAVGSIFGANTQAGAANNAARLQSQLGNRALDIEQNQLQMELQSLAPYLSAGTNALAGLTSPDVQSLLTANPVSLAGANPAGATLGNVPQWNFQPLTLSSFQASPGYQYQLGQAQQAIQNSAAGRTGALSGNTLQALQQNATGLAAQDWWNAQNFNQQNYLNQFNAGNQNFWQVYNALNQLYNQRLGGVQQQQANTANYFGGLVGSGQNAAVNLGSFGLQGAGQQAGTLQNIASGVGNYGTQGANALASGIIGGTNAATGGINSALTNQLIASALGMGGGGGGGNNNNFINYLFGGGGGANAYALNSLPNFGFGQTSA